MTNYFNTSSSFAMTSQPPNSPTIISPNYLDQQIYNQHTQLSQYRIQDIYQGLIKIKTNKTLIIIKDIIERKIYFWKLFAFGKLTRKYTQQQLVNQKYKYLYRLLCHFGHNQTFREKYYTFQIFKGYYQNQRNKDLRILTLFCNKYIKNKYNNLHHVFNLWTSKTKTLKKSKLFSHPSKNLSPQYIPSTQLPNSKIAKTPTLNKSIACKLLATLLKTKLFSIYSLLTKSKKSQYLNTTSNKPLKFDQNIPTTIKNSLIISTSNSYKSKHISATILKQPNLQQPISNSKKMIKNKQKSVQYVLMQKNVAKICLIFYLTFKKIVDRRFRDLFKKIKCQSIDLSASSYQQQNIQQPDQDTPQIYTNILKHMCWISVSHYLQQTKKADKNGDKQKKMNFKLLLLKNKRKQNYIIKNIIKKWKKYIIEYKFYIAENIKKLQDVKEKYIQSYI